MQRSKRILDHYASEIARLQRCVGFATIVDSPTFNQLKNEWSDEPQLCAHLYEAIGAFNLMLVASEPKGQLNYLLLALGDLTKAAFFYRQAGRLDQSLSTALRVLAELRQLVGEIGLRTERDYNKRLTPPYVWEMLGDAATCVAPAEARAAYAKAEELFAPLSEHDEMSEGADPFPGWHFSFMIDHFLESQHETPLHSSYKVRLQEKKRQWLGD